MYNPFKRKTPEERFDELDRLDVTSTSLSEKIRDDITKLGGFAIIGILNPNDDAAMSMVCQISKTSKNRVLFAVVKALGMDDIDVLLALKSQKDGLVQFVSPISKADVEKK